DGTNRVLVGFRPCEVTKEGVVTSCANLSDEALERVGDENRPIAEVEADTLQNSVQPNYAIYMYDPAKQTWLIVAAPPAGFMFTDPIALQPRAEPNAPARTSADADLAAAGKGLIEVRSVYDTDGLGRMGDSVLGAVDLAEGCTTA